MKVVTGHQPAYLPWLGLFHKIALADDFVFMDDVQYLDRCWNNRNRVKGPHGPFWLTVPVRRGDSDRGLGDVSIAEETGWQREHLRTLRSCYGRAPYWRDHVDFFEDLLLGRDWTSLVALDAHVMRYLLDALGIGVRWVTASEMGFRGRKSALILDHCLRLDADAVVLGRHGREYLDESAFRDHGIEVRYQDYRHPTYPQRFGAFCPNLSVVDLLLNCGPASRSILLSGNVERGDLGLGRQDEGVDAVAIGVGGAPE